MPPECFISAAHCCYACCCIQTAVLYYIYCQNRYRTWGEYVTANKNEATGKAVALYQFIRELNKLKQTIIVNAAEYDTCLSIRRFPDDPENIHTYFRDRTEAEDAEEASSILLSVHKPEFQPCPSPDAVFAERWLLDGWDFYQNPVSVHAFLPLPDAEDEEKEEEGKEYFEDDAERVAAYQSWREQRDAWAQEQKLHAKTRDLFSDLYHVITALHRESETLEFIVADGFIRDSQNPDVHHPVLTRRVQIRLDAEENTIYIEDSDADSQIYTEIFQVMPDIDLRSINRLREQLTENDYHPLDRIETPAFFKSLIHQLSSSSLYAEDTVSKNWNTHYRLLLYRNPCYILRKRMDGTGKAIEQIIETVEETGDVPAPIHDIVCGGKIDVPEDTAELSVQEQLASVGGESVDILLSKEANREQLEIARRIEQYNAVLVQGPPGTGKTHTIANLLGHFLAQGKSVLVTSHTPKALGVLKEKVASGLQNLCVSMLNDSHEDMQRSIDSITDYMSNHTSYEVKKEMEQLGLERQQVIQELAETRKKLFAMIHQECDCITYNGESVSPTQAAAFVQEHSEDLSYIPGIVHPYEPLPLSFAELTELYRSNEVISPEDESELQYDLPNPEQLLSPSAFEQAYAQMTEAKKQLQQVMDETGWSIDASEQQIDAQIFGTDVQIPYISLSYLSNLSDFSKNADTLEPWMIYAASDGNKGSSFRKNWLRLIEQITKTCEASEALAEQQFGKTIQISADRQVLIPALQQLKNKYEQKGKIGKLDLLFNKSLEVALTGVSINGSKPSCADDCAFALTWLEVDEMRKQCAAYWDDLMGRHGVCAFFDLDPYEPERIAQNHVPIIQKYLDWYRTEHAQLIQNIDALHIPSEVLFEQSAMDSDITATKKVLHAIHHTLPLLCRACDAAAIVHTVSADCARTVQTLQIGTRLSSELCQQAVSAIQQENPAAYRDAFAVLESTSAKYASQKTRNMYLKRLQPVAPQWADAIRDRVGIHGSFTVPSDIEDAWKWKQYAVIVAEIIAQPFDELQKNSLSLSKRYREITAQYAEKCAWYHLLRRTEHDLDMKMALQGWVIAVRKIGKGTGKSAPMYRAEARKQMAKCQNAVPAWIMPMNKALETLHPRKNKFDIVIIDEASQSDISSLAILYMGKKLIIVGDDKQVSPMAVGVNIDQVKKLQQMYLDSNIPNAFLFEPKTSIYDVAKTVFQPLMLREHFRCVPEIIGFSNWLSYDFKIKPLRDDSNSVLLPAVVNYRVADGRRIGKSNPKEAQTIVALMQACMEQPEYEGKTFGVISLLGDDQVKKLQEEIDRNFDAKTCAERHILCGNSSNFQGDERDVIFLSLVDCANGEGPVSKQGPGIEDSTKKRYNVAASRAKDQLWVVHSLDQNTDLKSGDLRKQLIQYAIDPSLTERKMQQIEQRAESPFEEAVAKYLAARGYHLVQQWKVGAYRLDMVVVCGKKMVAIECDGERWHSGEAKIREDMERQTILERLGWRFIRIRGSEYYRDAQQTMQRVMQELTDFEIMPEETQEFAPRTRDTELLQRVKTRAHALMQKREQPDLIDVETIRSALQA